MIDYNKIHQDMKRKQRQLNSDKFENQFTCNYCPATGHSLCTHKNKCLMNEDILEIVCELSRVNKRINWIKSSHVGVEEEITLNNLNEIKRELYRKYNSIETVSGGDER